MHVFFISHFMLFLKVFDDLAENNSAFHKLQVGKSEWDLANKLKALLSICAIDCPPFTVSDYVDRFSKTHQHLFQDRST